MSEPKRVHFETNGVKKSSSSESPAADTRKTIRLELNLSTGESYPEFNFLDLVAAEKKKQKIPQLNGFGNQFEDNDEDVRRAQEFERKYGNAYNGSGSNKRRMNTSVHDKGSGYDQSDPFIDDAIKYDENVPDELETDYGGFYINSGPLQFKKLANFERPEDAQKMPKPRKRAISSASSDSNESNEGKNGQPDKKAKLSNATVSKENVKSKAKPNEEDIPKKEVTMTTVKDMLRNKRDNKRNSAEDVNGVKPGQTMTTTEDSSSSSDSSDSSDDEEEDIENEAAGNAEGAVKVPEKTPTGVPSTSGLPVASIETNGEPAVEPVEVKLPENLPENLRQKIKQMEDLAKSTTKVLSDNESQALLYEIDMLVLNTGAHKSKIYQYLAPHVGCTYQTLTNRMKKMRTEKEDELVRPLFEQLKRGIDVAMTGALEQHLLNCQKVTQLKAAADANPDPDKPVQTFKNPRRKFPWSSTLRKTMEDIVAIKRQSFKRIGTRGTEVEYIEKYFLELVRLWPDYWMKVDELKREFLKDANRKPKENKKPTDKTSSPQIKLPSTTTAAKKPKPATILPVNANSNNVKMKAIELTATEKSTNKAPIVKTEKRLSDITSKVTGASTISAVISTVAMAPADMKSSSTANASNKTMKSNQNQQVIHCNTATTSAKPINHPKLPQIIQQSIEILSSPEKNSPSKKASDHSINHIISLPPSANNNSTAHTPTKYRNNTSNASSHPNNAFNNFDNAKSKSQSSKLSLNPNVVSNHGSKTSGADSKIRHESRDKTVHVIKDSSSEDEVQIVDISSPKHVAFASSSDDPKSIKHKQRDKNKPSLLAANQKQRQPKSILKSAPHSSRDPLADDDDMRNAESTMSALKELSPQTIN